MTNSKANSQTKKYKEWTTTPEAYRLRRLEDTIGLRLDGIAYFFANNPVVQNNDRT